jgi:septin 7
VLFYLCVVDNEDHNDFIKLRQMLIRTHMEELKEVTASLLYENYRSQKLSSGNYSVDNNGEVNPLLKFEEERAAHEAKMAKLENEMKQVFEMKVAEKEAKMRQNEEDLYTRHRESREALEKKRLELEEKKRRLEGKGAIPVSDKTKPKKTGLFSK